MVTKFRNADFQESGRCFFACVASLTGLYPSNFDTFKFENETWYSDVLSCFQHLKIDFNVTHGSNVHCSPGNLIIACLGVEGIEEGHAVILQAGKFSAYLDFSGDLKWHQELVCVHDPGDGSCLTREIATSEILSLWKVWLKEGKKYDPCSP